jgi:deoxycytidine triphosphate deaminase
MNQPRSWTEDEIEAKYKQYKSEDPFPEIPPALLNSADITDYVNKTGMVDPFQSEPEYLKPASYEVNLLGTCIYWDEKGNKCKDEINSGKEFILRKNSIAFVTLEPIFRLPDYIAIRFNLKITHIYRGLLLGTGPLIDPGFVGRLSLPLHNLTTNDYTFRGGEGLIWMEFTKISPNRRWYPKDRNQGVVIVDWSEAQKIGEYQPFPENKNKMTGVEDYLNKADPHRPKRSSIPDEMRKAMETAEKSQKAVSDIKRYGWLTLIAIIIALIISMIPLIQLVQDSVNYVTSSEKVLSTIKNDQTKKIEYLEKEVRLLKEEMQSSKKVKEKKQ